VSIALKKESEKVQVYDSSISDFGSREAQNPEKSSVPLPVVTSGNVNPSYPQTIIEIMARTSEQE